MIQSNTFLLRNLYDCLLNQENYKINDVDNMKLNSYIIKINVILIISSFLQYKFLIVSHNMGRMVWAYVVTVSIIYYLIIRHYYLNTHSNIIRIIILISMLLVPACVYVLYQLFDRYDAVINAFQNDYMFFIFITLSASGGCFHAFALFLSGLVKTKHIKDN